MNDDLHDPELSAMLGRASGAYPDVNVAYEAVRGRVRQAKRRRMAIVGSTACALLLAATVIGVQAARDGADGTSVADTPNVVVETSRITSTSDDDGAIVTVDSTDDSTDDSSDGSSDDSVDDSIGSAPETSAPSTSDDTGDDTGDGVDATTEATAPGSSGTSGGTGGSSSTTGTTKPALATGKDQVATSPGGSVTYSFEDGELVLVSVQAAPGWSVDEREVEDDRIRVEFEDADGSTTWRVEIRTEGGKAPVVTSEHG